VINISKTQKSTIDEVILTLLLGKPFKGFISESYHNGKTKV
jgi:hypothetical protein